MSSRQRKLAGTVLLLVLIIVYAILAAALSPAVLRPDSAWTTQLAFYAVAGLGWTLPAGVLIKWMAKTDGNPT